MSAVLNLSDSTTKQAFEDQCCPHQVRRHPQASVSPFEARLHEARVHTPRPPMSDDRWQLPFAATTSFSSQVSLPEVAQESEAIG